MMTAGEMLEALLKLPSDAELVITESGYYCGELADVMLPEPFTNEDGKIQYRIGHSHQGY
jgi:hypothetical protein